MTLPNFLVIGAAKSGTTSLHHYLRAHPAVFTPELKEPRYFALAGKPDAEQRATELGPWKGSIWRLDDYERLFDVSSAHEAIGECSPVYLYSKEACDSIHAHVPEARLIAILRNPVDRAYSHTAMHRRHRNTAFPVESFEAHIATHNWILQLGCYATQLRRYLEKFPAENLKVVLFEDLARDAACLMTDLYRFLGVDTAFTPNVSLTHNASRGRPRRLREHASRLIHPGRHTRVEARRLPPMSRETRIRLIEHYEDEIAHTEALIERDLSAWRRAD